MLWLSVILLRNREREIEREKELLAYFDCVVAVCYLAEEEIEKERAACLF